MNGPSFRFRLERVRAVRERKEKLAQQELAAALARRTSADSALRGTEEHVQKVRREQRTAAAGSATMGAAELLARQAFLERIEAQRAAQELELQRCESDVHARSAELTTAAGEHEMLNRLRDRHRGEHDRDVAQRERNVLDEIATMRVGRSPA